MSNASEPKDAADDIVDRLASLSEEFPNWTIKLVDSFAPYQAVRNDAGLLMLGAGSCAGLRVLLEEADGVAARMVSGMGPEVRR